MENEKENIRFRRGFLDCYSHFLLKRPKPDNVRVLSYEHWEWHKSYADGWAACVDASEERATDQLLRALDMGLLAGGRQAKLSKWANSWEEVRRVNYENLHIY